MLSSTRLGHALPAQVCAYLFLTEFILLYPLYAVLFVDAGLSVPAISSLFVIWSLTSVLVEIPSGALADVVSRKLLLIVGPALAGVGFGLWVAFPSYAVFAVGFVLWGSGGALQSGALEALVYEELDHRGRSATYAKVIGRGRASAAVAAALAMAAASPVFAIGGYAALGGTSVAACLLAAVTAMTFSEHPHRRRSRDSAGFAGITKTVRIGVSEVAHNRRLRALVIFAVLIATVWGVLDEYVPLLAAEAGFAETEIPLVVLTVYVGVAAGGLLGGVGHRLSRSGMAGVLMLAGFAMAIGAMIGSLPGFGMIGLAFCAFQMAQIAVDAHIQDTTSGEARSTVTSVAGFGTEIAAISTYAMYGLGSNVTSHAGLFVVGAAAYLILSVALATRVSPPRRVSRT